MPTIKKYTYHPGSKDFSAPKIDPQAPPLTYKREKDAEIEYKLLQGTAGAGGHMVCELMVDLDEAVVDATKTISELKDTKTEITRDEFIEIVSDLRDNILIDANKKLVKVLDMFGASHRTAALLRRGQILEKITQSKGARNICKQLNPTPSLLFGGGLGDVAKHLKDSGQLNPLQDFYPRPNKYKAKFGQQRTGYAGNYAGGDKSKGFRNRFRAKKSFGDKKNEN